MRLSILIGNKYLGWKYVREYQKFFKPPIVVEWGSLDSLQNCLDNYSARKDGLHCDKCNMKSKTEMYILLNSPGLLKVPVCPHSCGTVHGL